MKKILSILLVSLMTLTSLSGISVSANTLSDETILVDADFEDLSESSLASDIASETKLTPIAGTGQTVGVKTINGNNVIELYSADAGQMACLDMSFETVSTGVLEASMKINTNGDLFADWSVLHVFIPNRGPAYPFKVQGGNWSTLPGNWVYPQADSEGWYNLKIKFSRATTAEGWTYTIYDVASDNTLLEAGTVDLNSVSDISSAHIGELYSLSATEHKVYIDDIVVKTYDLTGEATEKNIVDADFEDLSESSSATDITSATKLTPIAGTGQTVGVKTINGNNVIELYSANAGQMACLDMNFEPVSTGVLEASMKINTNGDLFTDWSVLHMFVPNRGPAYPFKVQGGNWSTLPGNWVHPQADSEGWYNLKIKFSRATTAEGWTYTIYDVASDNAVLETGTVDLSQVSTISTAHIGELYSLSAEEHRVYIDDIVVKTYRFAGETKKEYNIVDADFEDLSESSSASDITSETKLTPIAGTGQTVGVKTINGNNVIELYSANANQMACLDMSFETVSTGVLEASMKINTNGDLFTDWSVLHVFVPNRGPAYPFKVQGGNWSTLPGNWVHPQADSEGWYNLKIKFSRATATEGWTYAIYDVASDNELLETGTVDLSQVSDISSAHIGELYSMSATEHRVYIDDIVVKTYSLTSATKTEYNSEANEAYIYFENDIDADSINKDEIKLEKDAVIENAVEEVSYDETARKMTVKFNVNPGTADYTVSFGNIVDVNGDKLLDATLTTDAKAFNLISMTEGFKTKELIFSGNVDSDTLSAITLTKADGTSIKGAYTVSSEGSVVTIKHGVLEAGSYIINITDALKDETGTSVIAEEKTFVVESAGKTFVNTGFDALTEDSSAEMIAGVTKLTPIAGAGQTVGVKTINGNNVIELYSANANQGAYLDVEFETVSTGVLEASMKINTNGDSFTDWSVLHVFVPNRGPAYPFKIQGGNWSTLPGNWVHPQADSEGWYNLKIKFSRATTTEGWTYAIYDVASDNELLETGTVDLSQVSDISSAHIGELYAISTTEHRVYIDDIVVKTHSLTGVVKTEYNDEANEAYIYFENDIDADSINKDEIKLEKDAVVENAVKEVSYDETSRKMTVKFNVNPGTADYTMSFGNIVDVNGNKLLDATLTTDAKALTLYTVTEYAKSKVLVFSGNIDSDTLSGITLTKEDGTSINSLYNISAKGTTVTINHGVLEAGNYKINITNALKDEAGNSAIEDVRTFVAVDDVKTFVNTGFDALTEDSSAEMIAGVTKLTPIAGAGQTVGVKTINGNNVIELYSANASQMACLDIDFETVSTGVLEASMKINTNGDFFADWSVLHMFIPNRGPAYPFKVQGGNWSTLAGNWVYPEADSEGWYNLKITFSRDTATEGWTYTIYDVSNNTILETGTVDLSQVSDISSAHIGELYSLSATEHRVYIDDIVVKAYSTTSVLKTEYNPIANEAYIYFDNDVNATTVKAENISISTTGVIPAIVSQAYYSDAERKLTVEFAKPIDSAEYVINFDGVTDAKGNLLGSATFAGVANGVVFENVKFMSGDNQVRNLPLDATEIAISADVKNVANAEADYEVVLAVYNGGRLETVLTTGAQKTTADGTTKPVYINATELTLTEDHEIKVFFFEKFSNLSTLRVQEVLSPVQFQ